MLYETDSQIGRITLDNGVLGSIILQEVAETEGKIILCSSKGKPVRNALKKTGPDDKPARSINIGDESGFFDISWDEDRLNINVYIIVRLGGSINTPAETLNSNLNVKIRELLGLSPASITVIIKGILSKNISRRDIHVSKTYDLNTQPDDLGSHPDAEFPF